MNYTPEELEHFARLAEFFGQDFLIDEEYPCVLDDRLLNNSKKVRKTVIRDGKRRSMTLHPVSIYTKQGVNVVNKQVMKYSQEEKQFNNPFITFVVHRWEEFATNTQRRFVEDMLNGKGHKYTKQQKWQFRNNLQRRLKMAFIGSGGDCVSIYRMGEFRTNLNIIEGFIEVDHDNELYSQEIIKNIDREYVNQIIYERLSVEAQQAIVSFYFEKIPRIEPVHLYEFHSIILNDFDRYQLMGLK